LQGGVAGESMTELFVELCQKTDSELQVYALSIGLSEELVERVSKSQHWCFLIFLDYLPYFEFIDPVHIFEGDFYSVNFLASNMKAGIWGDRNRLKVVATLFTLGFNADSEAVLKSYDSLDLVGKVGFVDLLQTDFEGISMREAVELYDKKGYSVERLQEEFAAA